jgi:Fur family ferric uptake transcriptional regulator
VAARARERDPQRKRSADPQLIWRVFLGQRGLNASRARDAVVATFLESKDHVDLQALCVRARRRQPGVGFATVYRTMKLLEEAGLAHARRFGNAKETLYEVAVGRAHHDHLICEQCGEIVEFVSDEVENLQDRIASDHGFSLSGHRHELYGICGRCRGRRKSPA